MTRVAHRLFVHAEPGPQTAAALAELTGDTTSTQPPWMRPEDIVGDNGAKVAAVNQRWATKVAGETPDPGLIDALVNADRTGEVTAAAAANEAISPATTARVIGHALTAADPAALRHLFNNPAVPIGMLVDRVGETNELLVPNPFPSGWRRHDRHDAASAAAAFGTRGPAWLAATALYTLNDDALDPQERNKVRAAAARRHDLYQLRPPTTRRVVIDADLAEATLDQLVAAVTTDKAFPSRWELTDDAHALVLDRVDDDTLAKFAAHGPFTDKFWDRVAATTSSALISAVLKVNSATEGFSPPSRVGRRIVELIAEQPSVRNMIMGGAPVGFAPPWAKLLTLYRLDDDAMLTALRHGHWSFTHAWLQGTSPVNRPTPQLVLELIDEPGNAAVHKHLPPRPQPFVAPTVSGALPRHDGTRPAPGYDPDVWMEVPGAITGCDLEGSKIVAERVGELMSDTFGDDPDAWQTLSTLLDEPISARVAYDRTVAAHQ